jgi:CRISPR system Cascade subunit CasD
MSKLTFELNGVLGAFGNAPKAEYRLTKSTPQRSHIIGLIACCMGLGRDDDWGELKELKVKVNGQSEEILRDYHTVRGAVTNDGTPDRNVITQREYLCSPTFTVTVSGGSSLIDKVRDALRKPVWQPYLGRRCCVPSSPLVRLQD